MRLFTGYPPLQQPELPPPCLGRLSQSILKAQTNSDLTSYLLKDRSTCFDKIFKPVLIILEQPSGSSSQSIFSNPHSTLLDSFLRTLSQEALLIRDTCLTEDSLLSRNVSPDIIHVMLQVCLIGYSLLFDDALVCRHQALCKILDDLRDSMKYSLLRHHKRREFLFAYCDCIGSVINYASYGKPWNNPIGRGIMIADRGLDLTFWQSTQVALYAVNGISHDGDMMDLDEDFEPQASQSRDKKTDFTSSLHDVVEARTSVHSFRGYISAKLCWLSMTHVPSNNDDALDLAISTPIVDYLTSLRREDFVLCANVLKEIVSPNAILTEDDIDTILQYIQQVIVKPYETEKSEAAIGICVDTLAAFVPIWTTSENADLATTGAELYVWFLTKLKDRYLVTTDCHSSFRLRQDFPG